MDSMQPRPTPVHEVVKDNYQPNVNGQFRSTSRSTRFLVQVCVVDLVVHANCNACWTIQQSLLRHLHPSCDRIIQNPAPNFELVHTTTCLQTSPFPDYLPSAQQRKL